MSDNIIQFTYLNHSGKKNIRKVTFECIEYINKPGFGYQAGWFISGYDHDKEARRSFSLNRIIMSDDVPPDIFRLFSVGVN